MKGISKNKNSLFKIILLSYLKPKSKKSFWRKVRDVYLPNIMKCFAISCLLLTIFTWQGINSGLKEEYQRFKKDPYTTAIFVTSNRFALNKDQVDRINILRYDPIKSEFNTEGRGNEIYQDEVFPFSNLDLIFYAKDGSERKSFSGRTVAQSDKKILQAITEHLVDENTAEYDLVNDWTDSEKGIIVSKYLVQRLGYKIGAPLKINRLIDVRFQNKNHSFEVPVKILAVAERMPFGDFIVSEEFNYNRFENTFNPFDTVERFHVLTPPEKESELEPFVKKRFNYCKKILRINKNKEDQRTRYEVVFKTVPFYKEEKFNQLREESSKFFIMKQFKNSGFECEIDYYDWKSLPEIHKNRDPEFLTIYLKEKYIDKLDQLSLFLRESIGGIEMDDTILNIFENYHRDMRRFRRISGILYAVLIFLGIFVSIAIYIKSVRATMHRLGVFSAFGVSPNFLSIVLAVESIANFLLSSAFAAVLYFILPPLFISKEIAMSLTAPDIGLIAVGGSLLSLGVVYSTVKSMVKKPPYSLIDYRS
jgi:hypothetical protein